MNAGGGTIGSACRHRLFLPERPAGVLSDGCAGGP
jgi:hypothetical protein